MLVGDSSEWHARHAGHSDESSVWHVWNVNNAWNFVTTLESVLLHYWGGASLPPPPPFEAATMTPWQTNMYNKVCGIDLSNSYSGHSQVRHISTDIICQTIVQHCRAPDLELTATCCQNCDCLSLHSTLNSSVFYCFLLTTLLTCSASASVAASRHYGAL